MCLRSQRAHRKLICFYEREGSIVCVRKRASTPNVFKEWRLTSLAYYVRMGGRIMQEIILAVFAFSLLGIII